MKSRLLSFLGIGAIALAVACNSAADETTDKDSAGMAGESSMDNSASTMGTADANVQTSADGRRYVLRKRTGGTSTSGTGTTASGTNNTANDYDTVWLYSGTADRYYYLGGSTGRDTLYYNTDEWNTWWNSTEADNELKMKSGNTKVKVDDDGSWKVKDGDSKTKMNEDGKVKTKPKE